MILQTNGSNVENKVLDILMDHVRKVVNGAEVLGRLFDIWKTNSKNKNEFEKHFKLLNEIEIEANYLKKDAITELSNAPTLLLRQDLIRIIRSVDQIIDWGQGSAFFLENIFYNWSPPQKLMKILDSLIQQMISSTKLLAELIRALYQSIDKVIEISEEIEVLENNADVNYRSLIIELAKINDDAPKGTNVLIRESVDRIEEMIDSIRDTASYIRIYGISR